MTSIEYLLCVKYFIYIFLPLILTKINCKLEIIITLSGVAEPLSGSKVLFTPQRNLLAPLLRSLPHLSPLLCVSIGLKSNQLA